MPDEAARNPAKVLAFELVTTAADSFDQVQCKRRTNSLGGFGSGERDMNG